MNAGFAHLNFGNFVKQNEQTRYNYAKLNDDFMQNEDWDMKVLKLIDDLENKLNSQSELDAMYNVFCNDIFDELKKSRNAAYKKSTRKAFRFYKPYWNQGLTDAWENMKNSEREYLKSRKGSRFEKKGRENFFLARKKFDKLLKKTKRNHERNIVERLEDINTKNPIEFWKTIKNLGPKKKK